MTGRKGGSRKLNKQTPEKIWLSYTKGVNYNHSLLLYDRVKKSENFYLGKQWEGLNAPDLEQPVLNFLRPATTYMISMLVSDDVGVSIDTFGNAASGNGGTGFSGAPTGGMESAGTIGNSGTIDPLAGASGAGMHGGMETMERPALPDVGKLLAQEIERVIERTKAKSKNRDALRNAAVDGDCCFFLRFDVGDNPNDPGEIVIDQVDNTNIIFGNPFVDYVQEQPYLIVVKRAPLKSVRSEAKRTGVKDWENIVPDDDPNYYGEDTVADESLVTVLIKLWKDEEGFVHFCKTTQNVMLKADTNLGYRLYPVAYMSWEKIKNSYHGMPAITPGVIANQIYVNTLWALFMIHCKQMAFPKMFYDRTKIKQWTNKVGQAIGVTGDPNLAVAGGFRAPDFSEQALLLVEKTMQYTREFMGVSDAALGNVKPDNTSAIIAVQKASATPLELQRLSFYQFVEDYVRIIMDIIRTDYGLRWVRYRDDADTEVEALVDFSSLPYDAMDLKVEVGSAAYWSELTQIQTTDNLFAKGVITDAVTYLEAIPDAYVKNKQKIIDQLRERERQAAAMQLSPMDQAGAVQQASSWMA